MSPSYNFKRHDIGITRTDGTKVGLMLAKKNGVPQYKTSYSKYLVQQYTTSPTFGATDPEERLNIGQSDWRSGFGQYIANSDDPLRYFASYGMDARFKDALQMAYKPTAITLPTTTATNEANLDWETWSDAATPGTWTEDQPLDQSATAQAGTYAGSISIDCQWTKVAHQHILWNTEYRSRIFYIRGWGRVNAAMGGGTDRGIKFAIFDGTDRTYTDVIVANTADTYVQTAMTKHTVNAAAGELTIEVYVSSAAGGARAFYFDSMEFIDPTDGSPVCFAEYNDILYMAYGNNLTKLNASTGATFDYVSSFPTTITDLEAFQVSNTDYLVIAQGLSYPYWYMIAAETLTQSTAAVATYQFIKKVYTTALTLYGNDSVNTLRSTINPLNGGTAWSNPATTIDSPYNSITELVSNAGALYIMKEDMPYYLDSTGAVKNDLAPDMAALTSSTSGKNSKIWQNKVYIPAGTQALLEVGTSNTYITPAEYCTNLSDFNGRIQALAYDDQWLFAVLDNSTKVEVIAGRWETIGSTTDWVWHPLNEITLAGCETAFVSSVYQKRIYIASTSASDALYYIPIPTGYADISADSNRSYDTTANVNYLITSFYHKEFKNVNKAFIVVQSTLGHTYDADIFFECHYQKLGDSSWTDCGDFKGSATNRKPILYIPVDGSSNKPVSTMMRFKLVAKTDSATTTPILLDFNVQAVLYPDVQNTIECAIRCADGIKDKQGVALEGTNAAYIRTVINEAQSATYPATIYDFWGTTKTVKIMPIDPYSEIVVSNKDENPEQIYYLKMMEVTTST